MIIMKFGGTSLEDADAIQNAAAIILREQRKRLVVVSACAGVTNALHDTATSASEEKEQIAHRILDSLEVRHSAIANELLDQDSSDRFIRILWKDIAALKKLAQSVANLKELSARTLDQFMSFGEQWSALILFHFLLQRDVPVELIDASSVIITDKEFNRATPLFQEIHQRCNEIFTPAINRSAVVITQGFIGSTHDGIITTLGRGGSDYSASILGAALNAKEIQIWTDVNGILTVDPSILAEARAIPELSFDEASELAYFGAKVLHPSTILPAVRKNIPVRVLNSKSPDHEGTLIRHNSNGNVDCIVKSIAYKEGITVITIKSTEMLMSHTFLARLFEIFSRYKKSIDVIATAKVSVSLTIDDSSNLEKILDELREFAEVQVEYGKAVFCVVGENMKSYRGIAARIFSALDENGINVELISNGASHINLTFVIDDDQINSAVRALHNELFVHLPLVSEF
ncbi:lysine-sensitive aspartokinase 3 [bacterium]|nr:lysine-sensitive aspartokinase 3 [bacterium]